MKQIVLATKNPGKLREFKKAFEKLPFEILSLENFGELPDAVENGSTFIENARIKAQFFSEISKLPCLADDSELDRAGVSESKSRIPRRSIKNFMMKAGRIG